MLGPLVVVLTGLVVFERTIVKGLLGSPRFHRGVQKIHNIIHDRKYGRDPNEPLRQGEATATPPNDKNKKFFRHFVDEMRNQFRGTPTDPDAPVKPPMPGKKK